MRRRVQLNATEQQGRQPRDRRPLTRRAAAPGRSSSCCPRSGTSSARPSHPRGRRAARRAGAQLGAGDRARAGHRPRRGLDRRGGAGEERDANTSVHVGPDGEDRARLPQDPHVRRRGRRHELPRVGDRGAGRRDRRSPRPPTASRSGLTVCYDLRFPELYRVLAVRGARVLLVPAAFTLATTRDHWEVLLRARAIENQAFVVARQPDRRSTPGLRSGGRSMIVDPWGLVLATAPDAETVDRRRPRPRPPGRDPQPAALARQPPPGGLRVRLPRPGAEKRRADPRGRRARVRPPGLPHLPRVRHGRGGGRGLRPRLPLLPVQGRDPRHAVHRALERLLQVIAETDAAEIPAREKLRAIAAFIIDSYRHDPDLMKVIIVEVTRAANTFGPTHLPRSARPTRGSPRSSAARRSRACSPTRSPPSSRPWRTTARSSRS